MIIKLRLNLLGLTAKASLSHQIRLKIRKKKFNRICLNECVKTAVAATYIFNFKPRSELHTHYVNYILSSVKLSTNFTEKIRF